MTKKKSNTKVEANNGKEMLKSDESKKTVYEPEIKKLSRLFKLETIQQALIFGSAIKSELILLSDFSSELVEAEILVSQMYQQFEHLRKASYEVSYLDYQSFYQNKLIVEPYVSITIKYHENSIDYIKKVELIRDLYEDECLLSEYISKHANYTQNKEYYFLDVIGLKKSCFFVQDFKELKFSHSYFHMKNTQAENVVLFLQPRDLPESELKSDSVFAQAMGNSLKDYTPLLAFKRYSIKYCIEGAISTDFSCEFAYL